MHNALRWFLLWMLLPMVVAAADPPPPLTRSVLTTNIPAFGSAGQALFRTGVLPYLDWSNLVWEAMGTNALTLKLDSNWWWTAYGSKLLTNEGAFIASQTGLGTNTTISNLVVIGLETITNNAANNGTNVALAVGATGWSNGPSAAFRNTINGNSFQGTIFQETDPLIPLDPRFLIRAETPSSGRNNLRLQTANDGLSHVGVYFHGTNTSAVTFRETAINGHGRINIRSSGMQDSILNTDELTITQNATVSEMSYPGSMSFLGASASAGKIAIAPTAAASTREALLKGSVSDGGNSAFFIYNGTVTDNRFQPSFGGFYETDNARPSLNFASFISAGNDTSSATPLVRVSGFRTSSATDPVNGTLSTVTTRNILGVGTIDGLGAATDFLTVSPSGKVGVGWTNSPQSALHYTADNSSAYAMQGGTTNRPQLITLTTNGVLSVNPGGGLNPVGCYGSLMMNATNIVVCAGAASVYTNVAGTGYTTIVTNGFYGSTVDALTNLYAGYYRVTVCASAQGANNQATEWEVFTNGVACDLVGMKKTYDAAARMDDLSMTGIIYLPASCRTDFRVQDGGTGGSISIHRASITVGTP